MKDTGNNKGGASRRDFLKTSMAASAGFMIMPRHVLGGAGYTAPSDKLIIAGIGVGGKGASDLTSFHDSGKAEIAFLCDVDDARAADTVKRFPKAKYYRDFREMLDKEHKHIDAVSVSGPDHNHAAHALPAMELGKHVYVQKPLTKDVWEARVLTHAAKKYKVVTQMGNQGASGEGVRIMREWVDAGLIGDVHTIYGWTDRPVWPQGIAWPDRKAAVPSTLDWDLWLGTAPYVDYIDKLVPFNWRGWWDYGTGALGDMGCHIMEAPFSILGLQYVKDVQATVGSVYVDEFKRGYFPQSCPPSSYAVMTFPKTDKTAGDVKIHWMDGGIQPERPEELGPNEIFGDGGNGIMFVGSKGKILADCYAENPRLLPTSLSEVVKVPQKYARVPQGHYAQWVEACIAGYGNMEVSAPFEISGPLTEALLMANLAVRGSDLRIDGRYPGKNLKLLWDNDNMKVTNFDDVNQFVKREYRKGWDIKYNFS